MPRAKVAAVSPKLNAAFVDQISLKAHQALERSFLMPVLEWFCNDMSELV